MATQSARRNGRKTSNPKPAERTLFPPELLAEAASQQDNPAISDIGMLGFVIGHSLALLRSVDDVMHSVVRRAAAGNPLTESEIWITESDLRQLLEYRADAKEGLRQFRDRLPGFRELAVRVYEGFRGTSYCEAALNIIDNRLAGLQLLAKQIDLIDWDRIDDVSSHKGQAVLRARVYWMAIAGGKCVWWDFPAVDFKTLEQLVRNETRLGGSDLWPVAVDGKARSGTDSTAPRADRIADNPRRGKRKIITDDQYVIGAANYIMSTSHLAGSRIGKVRKYLYEQGLDTNLARSIDKQLQRYRNSLNLP